MRIAFINIRRIADNHVKLLADESVKPAALLDLNVVETETRRVTQRERDGIGHHVNGSDLTIRTLARQGQRYRTGSSP
ncbi:hypothetical protein D3C78_1477880 [compost metagenome]